MASELFCKALDRYLALERLLRSSVPSALTMAFVECYLELMEAEKISRATTQRKEEPSKALERFLPLFSKEASKRIQAAYSCANIKDLLASAQNRIAEIISSYGKEGFRAIYRARLISRLLVYMRNPSIPMEVGLAWDPYMNLPYIPSTSIKGVVRSYFKKYGIEVGKHSYEDLFGTTDTEGLLIFYDAYPVACEGRRESLLDLDVISPHYRETGDRVKISEVDVSPTPIVFLTVAPGTLFHVPVIIAEIDPKLVGDLLDKIGEALEEGIGAKTALGYGSFKKADLLRL